MSSEAAEHRAWVFVSHASADLAAVRKVRNYLEEKNAAPLLFHLKSLKHPRQFWPLIKSEIRERNFFLFCDSTAALESEWVKKERAEVARARRRRPIRTGSVSVEGGRIDLGELDAFLANTRAYLSFSRLDRVHVPKFVEALRAAGYAVWFDDEFFVGREKIEMEINSAVKEGWLIFFASNFSLHKGFANTEYLNARRVGAKVVAVIVEEIADPSPLEGVKTFDARGDQTKCAKELVSYLLTASSVTPPTDAIQFRT